MTTNTTCVDCSRLVYLVIRDDDYAECPRCERGYEIEERGGHQWFVPLGDDACVRKQRLERIRDWTEGEQPEFSGLTETEPTT